MKAMKIILPVMLLAWLATSTAQVADTTSVNEEKGIKADSATVERTEQPKIIYYKGGAKEQKKDRNDIRTLSGNMNHSGGFGALSFRSTSFRGETMVLAGLRGGWIINRTLAIGLEGHGIIPTTKYDDLDGSSDVVALGGYGGMFLELIFFSNEVVHVTFPVSGGAGWMGYNRDFGSDAFNTSGDNLVDEDVFWYVEPGGGIEVNLSRSFRLAMGVSKRFTQDLEIRNTQSNAFEKLNYYITLKVGGF